MLRGPIGLRQRHALAATSRDEAIRLAEDCSPDLAIVDLRMPGESGLTVARELRALDSTTFILILTGYSKEHKASYHVAALGKKAGLVPEAV